MTRHTPKKSFMISFQFKKWKNIYLLFLDYLKIFACTCRVNAETFEPFYWVNTKFIFPYIHQAILAHSLNI
jgi:hypothetical protein